MTNLAESFIASLKNERHYSIYTFLMEHMIKTSGMLVNQKEGSLYWKGVIEPKIEEKVMMNINKGEGYTVSPFMNRKFTVSMGEDNCYCETSEQNFHLQGLTNV